MKKIILLLGILGIFCTSNVVFAEGFSSLDGLTDTQLDRLTQIHTQYKKDYDALDTSIMEYSNKLLRVKNDPDKTPEQISILTGAYERNIQTLKMQQKVLSQKVDAEYKSIMTDDQYKQYQIQQMEVQDAFKKFLQK